MWLIEFASHQMCVLGLEHPRLLTIEDVDALHCQTVYRREFPNAIPTHQFISVNLDESMRIANSHS